MSDRELDDLQKLLGRAVSPSERHSVPSLDRLLEAQLAEARALRSRGGVGAVLYLRFLVRDASLSDAMAFAEDVLEKGADAATWETGPTLFLPHLRRSELIGISATTFEAMLVSVEGIRWRCLTPRASRRRWTSAVGEPGVLVLDGNHTIRAPRGTQSLVLGSHSREVEPVLDLTIGVRRWLTGQMVHHLAEVRSTVPDSADDILRILGGSGDATTDARVAARALVREVSLADVHDLPPGFRGPDDWYADPEE